MRSRGEKLRGHPRRPTDLRVQWSKREDALLYHGEPSTAGWLSHILEMVALPHDGRSLAKELEARGYDLTTLRFQIRRKEVP